MKRLQGAEISPQDSSVTTVGGVFILHDPNEMAFFNPPATQVELFDNILAYKSVRSRIGDSFDFVAFIIDTGSGLIAERDHQVTVFNDVKGINHVKGAPFSARSTYANSTKLLGIQVHFGEPTLRKLLHEVAHAWCAYATFKDQSNMFSTGLLEGPTAQARFHWGPNFDDGRSCMDYDLKQWEAVGQKFKQKDLTDGEFEYCPLDLYPMGMISKEQAEAEGSFKILISPTFDQTTGLFTATVKTVTINDVILSCGPRIPSSSASQHKFRQAFVVVTKNLASGQALAARIDTLRKRHEENFARATRGIGAITTA